MLAVSPSSVGDDIASYDDSTRTQLGGVRPGSKEATRIKGQLVRRNINLRFSSRQ